MARIRHPVPGGYSRTRRKYGNVPTTVDGIYFDSKWEAEHYRELRLREAAGDIIGLACQVPFVLTVHGSPVGTYVADFVYTRLGTGLPVAPQVIEDTKSPPTRKRKDYRLKRKIMAAHGHEIVEILRPARPSRRERRARWEAHVTRLARRQALERAS
jgi:hypothetical protein